MYVHIYVCMYVGTYVQLINVLIKALQVMHGWEILGMLLQDARDSRVFGFSTPTRPEVPVLRPLVFSAVPFNTQVQEREGEGERNAESFSFLVSFLDPD